jgi:transporter family-2 protein
MDTFKEMLEECARKWAQRPFIIFGNREISFQAFDEMANQAAHLFLEEGIRKGDRVLLFLPNCLEFLYAWCGASKIGAVVVPTNFSLKASELSHNVNHSESNAIVTQEPYADVFREIRGQCPRVTHCFLAGDGETEGFIPFNRELSARSTRAPDIRVLPDDLLVILYTSGTTGRPKGVMHSHATYLFTIQAFCGTRESIFITYGGGGLLAFLAISAVRGGNLSAWQEVPWYALSAGVLGLVIVGAIGYTVPRLGLSTVFTIIVAAQFIIATVIDHFGLLGAAARPFEAYRLAGIAFLILGVSLMTR